MAMKDLSKDRSATEVPEFKIGNHVYRGLVGLPSGVLLDIAVTFSGAQTIADVGQQVTAFQGLIGDLLEDDSTAVFLEMMRSRDPQDMIDLEQLEGAITYLMEAHGIRPTTPSEESSPGQPSPGSGIDWTGSTSGEVSISAASPSTGY